MALVTRYYFTVWNQEMSFLSQFFTVRKDFERIYYVSDFAISLLILNLKSGKNENVSKKTTLRKVNTASDKCQSKTLCGLVFILTANQLQVTELLWKVKDIQIKRLLVTTVFSILLNQQLQEVFFRSLTQNTTGQETKKRIVYCTRTFSMTPKCGDVAWSLTWWWQRWRHGTKPSLFAFYEWGYKELRFGNLSAQQ